MSVKGDSIEPVEMRVIEECAELIKALCKATRFGLYNYHPLTPETTNRQEIVHEIMDVMRVVGELQQSLLKDCICKVCGAAMTPTVLTCNKHP